MKNLNQNNMTAVEWLVDKLDLNVFESDEEVANVITKAKEMEKQEKIEFACKVAEASAEKYIQGKTTEQIAKELLTFKLK
jgi:hypothetical protein